MELEEQPTPDVSVFCPDCGADPVYTPDEKLAVQHRLSAAGYLHDDMTLRCSDTECRNQWTHGVPVDGFDGGEDLVCDSCKHDPECDHTQYYRVHRSELRDQPTPESSGTVIYHLKCPRCYLFTTMEREVDNRGVSLVGYPDITGSMDGADPYGWAENPPGTEGDE